jgi:hypothetical protein
MNLITGKKIGQRVSPVSCVIGNFLGAIALPLLFVLLALGGWYYWDHRNKVAVRIEAEQQHAVNAAQTEKLRQEQALAERLKEQKCKEDLAKAEQEKKVREEQRKAKIERCRMLYCDSPTITLFDALTAWVSESDQQIAIDPVAVDAMARIRVDIAALPVVTDTAALADFLGKRQFVIRKCPVSDKGARSIDLVTTEPIWAYNHAVRLLQKHQLDAACQVLTGVATDNSTFGIHCQTLRSLLTGMKNNRDELAKLATQVRETTANCLSNYKFAQAAARFASGKSKSPASRRVADPEAVAAEKRYQQSLANLRVVAQRVDQFAKKLDLDNQAIWLRHLEAHQAQLYTEALALLDIMIEDFTTLRSLCDELGGARQNMNASQMEGIETVSKTLGQLPPSFLDRQLTLQKFVLFSSDRSTALFSQSGPATDIADGLKLANEAFAGDRGNVLARAAAGYFRVQWHAKAANAVFRGGANRGAGQYEELAREFRDKRKEEMLRTALELAGRTNSVPRVDSGETTIGTATGLCVWNAKGALFPLSARIAPSLPSNVSEDGSDTYWGRIEMLARNKLAATPINFGGYGCKDMYVCQSVVEVYKWLCVVTTNKVPRLHIEFQDIELGKVGDSAGVTMAVAAYSSFSGQSIRQDVAMTGSFRFDGSVQPVGSIFEKVDAAVTAPSIEIVLLPKGNEADGALIPIDKLCRIVIVSSEDVQTYIKYATDPNYNRDSLASLRKAQALILGGQWERAESLLVEVAADCPEIYTARRLLELIAFWKKAESAKYKYNKLSITTTNSSPMSLKNQLPPANPETGAST